MDAAKNVHVITKKKQKKTETYSAATFVKSSRDLHADIRLL